MTEITYQPKSVEEIEIPPLKGFYRTHFGFYVADHKSPVGVTAPQTYEWLHKEGEIPIPNSYWSMIATLTDEEIEKIENPDIRKETEQARGLMLEYPVQFVNLMAMGNKILIEPYGFGCKILQDKLKGGNIEVYDHDVSKIKIGESQVKYNNAKLYVDGLAKEDDIRFAARGGDWGVDDRRFGVVLGCGPRGSDPGVAGLGFRPEGNQAYFNVNKVLEELSEAERIM